MGTSAGFFGITYQGASNGLASVTLSIFNVVCRRRPCPLHLRRAFTYSATVVCMQDHPDDRAWCKFVFDKVAPSGELTREGVPDFLRLFYRNRPQGNTLSGTYLYTYPENEKEFLLDLFGDSQSGTVNFDALIDALQDAQGTCIARGGCAPCAHTSRRRAHALTDQLRCPVAQPILRSQQRQ